MGVHILVVEDASSHRSLLAAECAENLQQPAKPNGKREDNGSHKGENAMITANTMPNPGTNPMHSTESLVSSKRLWASRVMNGLPVLFLLVDGGMKLFKPVVVVEATKQLGYPESAIAAIGVVLLISTFLYLIPRTAILGAILLTGYLGGAVATQVRVSAVLFNIVFPVIVGGLLWGGLWLRDRRLQALIPLRAQ